MRRLIASNGLRAGSLLLCLGIFGVAAFGRDTLAGIVQLAELTASDGASFDELGISVGISGNTVVVGAAGNSSNTGAAYVFVKPSTGWTNMTQTAKLTASDGQSGDELGISVAINGNTIVAGAPQATDGGETVRGAVYVFVEPSGGWVDMTETAKLTSSNTQDFRVGMAVAIGGNTVVAGSSDVDEAFVFMEPKTGWANEPQTAVLTASDNGAGFGSSVSISSNVAVVGAPSGISGGALYVFVKPATGWVNETQTAKLTAPGRQTGDLGVSVSISGNTVVGGAPSAQGTTFETGAAYVFVEPPGGWTNTTPTATLTASHARQLDELGSSVAIVGNTVVAGAPSSGGSDGGSVYVFIKPKTGWVSMTNNGKLAFSGEQSGDQFGFSAALSGGTVVGGAPIVLSAAGAAFVFGKPQ